MYTVRKNRQRIGNCPATNQPAGFFPSNSKRLLFPFKFQNVYIAVRLQSTNGCLSFPIFRLIGCRTVSDSLTDVFYSAGQLMLQGYSIWAPTNLKFTVFKHMYQTPQRAEIKISNIFGILKSHQIITCCISEHEKSQTFIAVMALFPFACYFM